jgi:hypothetical protein
MLRLALLGLCLAIGLVAFLLIRDGIDRPSVPEVVGLARGPQDDDVTLATGRTIDGLGFPDWRRYGCDAEGGRLDRLEDDREAATVSYRCGAEQITYTIVSGTGNVDDETITVTRQLAVPGGGKLEVVQAQSNEHPTLKLKRAGRTIIIAGVSPNDALARKMRRLAVRGL